MTDLITCEGCGHNISHEAPVCEFCGRKQRSLSSKLAAIFAVVALGALFALAVWELTYVAKAGRQEAERRAQLTPEQIAQEEARRAAEEAAKEAAELEENRISAVLRNCKQYVTQALEDRSGVTFTFSTSWDYTVKPDGIVQVIPVINEERNGQTREKRWDCVVRAQSGIIKLESIRPLN